MKQLKYHKGMFPDLLMLDYAEDYEYPQVKSIKKHSNGIFYHHRVFKQFNPD